MYSQTLGRNEQLEMHCCLQDGEARGGSLPRNGQNLNCKFKNSLSILFTSFIKLLKSYTFDQAFNYPDKYLLIGLSD